MTRLDFGPFVLGGNVFGWTADRDASFRILDEFVARGGRAIDTADNYSDWVPGHVGGESETIIGEWMRSRGNRDQLVLASKVAKALRAPGLAPENIRAEMDGTLERLGTDRIDLYYAHEDDDAVAQEDYLGAFHGLVEAGKALEIGASNFTPERLRSAHAIAASNGLTPFTIAQDEWSLVHRDPELDTVPTLRELGIVELPYLPLASGFLTGKYRPGTTVDSQRAEVAGAYLEVPSNIQLLDALDEVASAHGASITAVSLAWIRQQDVVGAPIASARTPEQLGALFESATLTLSPAELATLAAITAPEPAAA
jgi:aryl-alcohol dehydrogenase-like predicted oxidoreductase